MNKYILNLGAIIVAFALGLAINQACADSSDTTSDIELRNLVSNLQREVNSLKSEVADLKSQIAEMKNNNSSSAGSSNSGEFVVGELTYGRDGLPINRLTKQLSQAVYKDFKGNITSESSTSTVYIFDSYGRQTGWINYSNGVESSRQEFVFEGKKRVSRTTTSTNTGSFEGTLEYTYE